MARREPRIFEKSGAIMAGSTVNAGISVATHMWLHWARIAIRRAAEARAARKEIVTAHKERTPLPIDKELRPALVTIAAAAHALDALHAELKPIVVPPALITAWKQRRPPRRNQIHETLQFAFRINAQKWRSDFEWLFGLRDDAVHPGFAFEEPTPTHLRGVNAAREYSVFTTAAADRAVAILFDAVSTGVKRPKKLAEDWAEDSASSVRVLAAEHADS